MACQRGLLYCLSVSGDTPPKSKTVCLPKKLREKLDEWKIPKWKVDDKSEELKVDDKSEELEVDDKSQELEVYPGEFEEVEAIGTEASRERQYGLQRRERP